MSISYSLSRGLLQLGEIIHGSDKEKKVIQILKEKFGGKTLEVKTKEWVNSLEFYANGEVIEASLLPYTSGEIEGIIGKEIRLFEMPPHPFQVKDLYEESIKEGFRAVIFYDSGKLRRISVGNKIPAIFTKRRLKDGDKVEINAKSSLVDVSSYNLEVTVNEGEDYVIVGAHIDHWLTGYHDNLFSLDIMERLISEVKLERHGLKFIFFSSEEGPKCCTGSSQYPKDNTFVMLSLDALFPNRVVFSATPDLFQFSKYFNVKRIEMPTPFSDHFPFVLEGYPGVVLYNDDLIPYYHSDQDLPIKEDIKYLDSLVNSIKRFLKELDKLSKAKLDDEFIKYAKSKGYEIRERKGSIIPSGLSSTFRKSL